MCDLSRNPTAGRALGHRPRHDIPSDLLFRPALLAQGYTDAELLRLRRSGALSTVRGGAYLPPGDDRLVRPEDRHALLVDATLPRLAPGAVVSHVSAAVAYGLPVWNVPLVRVHVTRDGRSGGRISGKLHLHAAAPVTVRLTP